MGAPFLQLTDVAKGHADRVGRITPILAGVDLTVAEGELVAILGASGSGKTTLLSLIAGLATPERGTIALDGVPIHGPGLERGVVFQNYSLLPWLTTLENVQLAVDAARPDWSPAARRARAEHWVRLVGLGAAADKRPAALSGGMRQRVSVARGLAVEPRLLLLDEPFSALDALTRATLQGELARLWATDRRTMLLITNDLDEACLLADRIHVLIPAPTGGSLLSPGIPVDLSRPRSAATLNRQLAYQQIRREILGILTRGNLSPFSTRQSRAEPQRPARSRSAARPARGVEHVA
jgi:nitrate/nitrite transport system ATP-binding protein